MGELARSSSKTRANIVVVSYDEWKDTSSNTRETMIGAWQRFNRGGTMWNALWMRPGAVFVKTARISTVAEKLRINSGPHRCTVVECLIRETHLSASGSVTLGLVASASGAGPYQAPWLNMVCSAVAGNQVRYICGVFWRGKDDTETL